MRSFIAASLVAFAFTGTACDEPDNPPITAEPSWSSSEVEAIARESCFDCHSNETKWPFYTTWPLLGSLVQDDVLEGRSELNFSEWDREQEDADKIVEVIHEGEMPLPLYVLAHPGAGLNDEEKTILARGIVETFERDPPPGADGFDGDDDDDDD
jgi:hypothetical protein